MRRLRLRGIPSNLDASYRQASTIHTNRHSEDSKRTMTLLRAITCAFNPASCKSSPHIWDDYLDGAAAAILWIESDEDEEIPFGADGFHADAVALRGDWVKVGRYVFNAMKSLDPIDH